MSVRETKKHYSDVEFIDLLHLVSTIYTSTKAPRDYGTGELYTVVDVHTLKYIVDHPGISVTEIAEDFGKTKGAISQILKKLDEKELIEKRKSPSNDSKIQLFVTKKGKELDKLHRKADAVGAGETLDRLRDIYSEDEIDLACNLLENWRKIRIEVQKQRTENRKAQAAK